MVFWRERSHSPRVPQVVRRDLARFDSDADDERRSLPERLGRVGVSDFQVERHAASDHDGRVPSTAPALSLLMWVEREGESCQVRPHARPNNAPFSSRGATSQSQGEIAHPTVGLGWRNSELLQPTSAGGADWSVGVSPSQEGRAQAVRAPLDADYQDRIVVREEDASHGRIPRPEADVAGVADPSNDMTRKASSQLP